MKKQNPDAKEIVVDYYDGAYGPTLRVDIQALDDLLRIKGLFLELAESKRVTVDFLQLDSIRATGIKKLILRRIKEGAKLEKALELKPSERGDVVFHWTLPSRGWRRCAGLVDGLIDGLIKGKGPGHQYLTEEGIDDAIVEMAFME